MQRGPTLDNFGVAGILQFDSKRPPDGDDACLGGANNEKIKDHLGYFETAREKFIQSICHRTMLEQVAAHAHMAITGKVIRNGVDFAKDNREEIGNTKCGK